MIPEFKTLTPEEANIMYHAPAYVSLLIAGVDENIEKKETESAIRFADFLSKNSDPALKDYYGIVNQHFKDQLITLLEKLPFETRYRNVDIAIELEKINSIWPKIDKRFAKKYYQSLLDFAKHVAKSSGGVFSMGSISPIEKKWIQLDMIENPE